MKHLHKFLSLGKKSVSLSLRGEKRAVIPKQQSRSETSNFE
jgi:hypothetical protein